MSLFLSTLCALVIFCFGIHWYTRTKSNGQSSAEFKKFQRTYVVVYLLATAADWLQGPHVYVLYQSYGLSSKEIGELFVGGFGSSMVFGTFIGSIADKYGRRLNCLLYAILYGLGCISKHFPDYRVLMVGRVLAGIATSILFSAFESWVVCDHANRNLNRDSLGILFANSVLGNSIVAVLAGVVAELAASKFGFIAPFDVSLFVLMTMAVIMMSTWQENYGNRSGDLSKSFKEAVIVLRTDRKVMFLGLIQSLFEGAMYIFVLEWTPALTSELKTKQGKIPHGVIFSGFMVSVMVGSALFKLLSKKAKVESFMSAVFFVSTVSLSTTVFVEKGHCLIYFSFLIFECCVGIFWPAMATMRGKYVPEKIRATIMNMFRIPLNLIVILVLLQDLSLQTVFSLCTVFLGICSIFQEALRRTCAETPEEEMTGKTDGIGEKSDFSGV